MAETFALSSDEAVVELVEQLAGGEAGHLQCPRRSALVDESYTLRRHEITSFYKGRFLAAAVLRGELSVERGRFQRRFRQRFERSRQTLEGFEALEPRILLSVSRLSVDMFAPEQHQFDGALQAPGPFAIADFFATTAGETLTINNPGFLANDVDLDGEALTATAILDNVDNGTLAAFADGSFTYTPNLGFALTRSNMACATLRSILPAQGR